MLNTLIHDLILDNNGWGLKTFLKENGEKGKIDQDPLLFIAIKNGSFTCVETLLELGCSIEQTDENGQNIFHIACANGDSNLLQIFLENIKQQDVLTRVINAQNKKSETPLMLAIINNQPFTVKKLFELAKDKIFINKFDTQGNTALHYATLHKNASIIKTLIDNGAKLNSENKDLQTFTDLATPEFRSEINNILLQKNYPLHYAAKTGDISKLKMALQSNEKLHVTDLEGNSLLHYAAMHGQENVVAFLVDVAKVPVDIKNNQSYTAYDLAYKHQQSAITHYLSKHYYMGAIQTGSTSLMTNPISQAVISGLVLGATTHLYNIWKSQAQNDGVQNNNDAIPPSSGMQLGTEIGYRAGTKISESALKGCSIL